jgi:hypothetical protein
MCVVKQWRPPRIKDVWKLVVVHHLSGARDVVSGCDLL